MLNGNWLVIGEICGLILRSRRAPKVAKHPMFLRWGFPSEWDGKSGQGDKSIRIVANI
jgi:hypothetical protein